MERILFWSLVITVGLAPLPLASNRPWGWGLLGLAVGVQLVVFAIAALFDGELIRLNWRRYGWAMLGFAALLFWCALQQSSLLPMGLHNPLWRDAGTLLGERLQSSLAINPAAVRETMLRLISYAGIFFLALHLCRSSARARTALWSIAIAGTGYAVYGLIVHLGHLDMVLWYPKWAYRSSLTSTFVNRNSFAAYAGMTLVVCLALLLKESERSVEHGLFSRAGMIHFVDNVTLGPFLLLVAAITIMTALLFTQSRGGFLSTGAGVLALTFSLHLAHRQRGIGGRMPLFALSLALGAVVLVSFSGASLMGRFGDFAGGDTGRGHIYEITLRAIEDHPWLGVGLGNFADVFRMYRDASLDGAYATFDRAHNTYLELALEIGLPAMFVWMSVLIGIVFICARGLVIRQRDLHYPAAGLAVTTLLGLHSVVDFSLQMPAIAAAYALVMGTAFTQSFPTRRSERRQEQEP